jgi:hypothetical protein
MRRSVLVVALGFVALVVAVTADSFFEIEVENNKYTVGETCLSNSLKLCSDDSADHKAFQTFANHQKIITQVSQKTDLWQAGHNKFSIISDAEKKMRAAAAPTSTIDTQDKTSISRTLLSVFPENFDSRQKWPQCIGAVRDQGNCGSCWSFSGTSVLSDRACIATGAKQHGIILAAQAAVSCAHNNGCAGGTTEKFWYYANTSGIVLDSCLPYVSGSNGVSTNVAACPSTCSDKKTSLSAATGTHFASQIQWFKSDDAVKLEVMTNGPIQARMDIYDDFFTYKGGIYHHVSGNLVGG